MEDVLETYKPASEVTIGDKVVESDGAYFEVTAITKAGRSFVFTLRNVNGHMIAPTSAKVGVNKNVRVLNQS